MSTLHVEQYRYFYHISLNFLRMKRVSDKEKVDRENQNTHFLHNNFFNSSYL
jgi:hypothetical protein